MWSDNETERDFLNFTNVADTVAEVIIQANGRPISIGLSGEWGAGKSSMIKLIRKSLETPSIEGTRKYLCVEFNAWLYQGYDDARAALMEIIANELAVKAEGNQPVLVRVNNLLGRINWLRAAKLAAGTVGAVAFGIPPMGAMGEAIQIGREVLAGETAEEDISKVGKIASKVATETKGLIRQKETPSPPKEIQAIRDNFESILDELGITLVVLIDDLDRCLPKTTISTLEAIRLLLFLKNTAFVIAADDQMIKHAVRQHFKDIPDGDEKIITSYFDKLVQVPIRVPPLGTQEVRAYLMLLYIENSAIDDVIKEEIRKKVLEQLGKTWQGKRVDIAFVKSVKGDLPGDLMDNLKIAEDLSPIMASATQIQGNPRLIKRFLNALSVRKAIARRHDIFVDEKVLAKMLLFERCGSPETYGVLTNNVNKHPGGKPVFLKELESKAIQIKEQEVGDTKKQKELTLKEPWNEPFYVEWLTLDPPVSELDLRGILYVSREHAQIMSPEDQLSSTGADILAALIANPKMASKIKVEIEKLSELDMQNITKDLLVLANQEKEWGSPPILDALLTVAECSALCSKRVKLFLSQIEPSLIKPDIVPKIRDQAWSQKVFVSWLGSKIKTPVKRAIQAEMKKK